MEDEEIGPPLPEKLATLLQSFRKKKLSQRNKKFLKQCIEQKNVNMLITPKVNSAVWNKVKPLTKALVF